MMTFSDKLIQYKTDGLLYSQRHPTLPLTIWNYTQKVQYENLWDDVTTICRGLVTDDEGNIVSRGFPKFFNIEENRHTPTDNFEVFEKLDGQYIGVFWYNGEMIVNSRGSFTSDYAVEARRILDEEYPAFKRHAEPWGTYCFELIGFEQIVVSYPEPDIILTGVFRNWDGGDYSTLISLAFEACFVPVKVVKKYDGIDYRPIKALNWKNAEGFVVRFSNGDRCKIKFEDYVRLHRVMTNISDHKIWAALKDGKPITELLEDVPDEFFAEVHVVENRFKGQYKKIINEIGDRLIIESVGNPSRKDTAIALQDYQYKSAAFAMLDDKDYAKIIWKYLEP